MCLCAVTSALIFLLYLTCRPPSPLLVPTSSASACPCCWCCVTASSEYVWGLLVLLLSVYASALLMCGVDMN